MRELTDGPVQHAEFIDKAGEHVAYGLVPDAVDYWHIVDQTRLTLRVDNLPAPTVYYTTYKRIGMDKRSGYTIFQEIAE